jgi:hypothetical protein
MNGRFLNLTAYVNSKFGPDASRLVLSVPINMAGIRFRCIPQALSVLSSNRTSYPLPSVLTLSRSVHPGNFSGRFEKCAFASCGSFDATKYINRPLNSLLTASTSQLAYMPCMDLYSYSTVLIARNVLTATLRLARAVCPR